MKTLAVVFLIRMVIALFAEKVKLSLAASAGAEKDFPVISVRLVTVRGFVWSLHSSQPLPRHALAHALAHAVAHGR